MSKTFDPFETNMEVDENRRIIAFSDIHADIEVLIICLRDCAQVIKKKSGFGYEQSKRDEDLYKQLKMDITDPDYNFDLNYCWCDYDSINANTIVVIIGDIIDGIRKYEDKVITSKKYMNRLEILYYPQVEMKILHFINALNRDSLAKSPVHEY